MPERKIGEIKSKIGSSYDFTVSLLSEVCFNVSVEPQLQPLTGETFPLASANVEDGARLDVAASGFWGSCHQKAFLDVRSLIPILCFTRAGQYTGIISK